VEQTVETLGQAEELDDAGSSDAAEESNAGDGTST